MSSVIDKGDKCLGFSNPNECVLPISMMAQASHVMTDAKNMNHVSMPPLNGLCLYKHDIGSYLVVRQRKFQIYNKSER